jgi:16S rRNA (adenine1518-N6/adenine1519-N6)-dimethyltransferase
VACTYSTRLGEYSIFTQDEAPALIRQLKAADLVVGFNHIGFDYEVLKGHDLLFDAADLPHSLDLLIDLEKALGHRIKLDAVAALEAPRQIVANLPYNVGTPLLIGWLRQAGAFERLTLMFQQEVAERICAAPDTSAYGRLAVLAQWRCRCELLLRLPPGAFSPPPKVWSAVVGFTPHAEDPPPALFATMEKLTAAAFGQRRKMLRGALKTLGNAEALLDEAGIAGDRRGETLTVAEFDRLARGLASRG